MGSRRGEAGEGKKERVTSGERTRGNVRGWKERVKERERRGEEEVERKIDREERERKNRKDEATCPPTLNCFIVGEKEFFILKKHVCFTKYFLFYVNFLKRKLLNVEE